MIKQASTAALRAATLTAALTAALACSVAFASDAVVPEFGEIDADGDGAMSESEWMDSPAASMMGEDMAAAHYGMYDIDGNGSVSGDEYAEVNRMAFEQMERKAI